MLVGDGRALADQGRAAQRPGLEVVALPAEQWRILQLKDVALACTLAAGLAKDGLDLRLGEGDRVRQVGKDLDLKGAVSWAR